MDIDLKISLLHSLRMYCGQNLHFLGSSTAMLPKNRMVSIKFRSIKFHCPSTRTCRDCACNCVAKRRQQHLHCPPLPYLSVLNKRMWDIWRLLLANVSLRTRLLGKPVERKMASLPRRLALVGSRRRLSRRHVAFLTRDAQTHCVGALARETPQYCLTASTLRQAFDLVLLPPAVFLFNDFLQSFPFIFAGCS